MARSTWHHRKNPRIPTADPVPQRERAYRSRLTTAEQEQIVRLVAAGFAAGRSVYASWFDALDAGNPIASLKSWYRIAHDRCEGQRPPRRRKKRRATSMPQFEATAVNQVWCWDITKLPGKYHRQWYSLYTIIDVFSRFVVGWRLEITEDDDLAEQMFRDAVANQGVTPQIVHSDGGSSMMSTVLAEFYQTMGITRSKNRPRVSNDNPFIESWFKTLKYTPSAPGWFPSLDTARRWVAASITDYNDRHKHSSLEGHTPRSVHDGTWTKIHQHRQRTLDNLAAQHPERYPNQPRLRTPLAYVSLNQPRKTDRLQTA